MKKQIVITCFMMVFVLVLTASGAVAYQESLAQEIMRKKIEQIRFTKGSMIGEEKISSSIVLPEFYERRNFRLAWTNPDTVRQLIDAIKNSDKEGLNPNDYHLTQIQHFRSEIDANSKTNPEVLVDFDLILTDSLLRLGYNIIFGKVDPEALDANWNLAKEIRGRDPAAVIEEAIKTNSIAQTITDLIPDHFFYTRLKSALTEYRIIKEHGGWKPVPEGPTLKKGMSDQRVIQLRRRLSVTGDLQDKSLDSDVFDDALEKAVIRFQKRHYLTADGVAGKQTLEAMNVPVEKRIDQIRVNLERARWVLHEIKGDFVLADIAGFTVFYVQDGDIFWRSRVQVGKPYRKTPVFKSKIKYLVLNPTWTVPPGILYKDLLPAVKKDPNYLRKKNINVIGQNGKIVNQDSIDWSRYRKGNFPYTLRQEPGPTNALGRIKFIFPNKHFVYLHDTPSKSLFGRTDRAFSSGCIRVQRPFELAELLLNDKTNWSREKIMKVIESKETKTVFLPEPVPVILLYWTVSFDENNTIQFKKDVYGRDDAVLKALEGAFKIRKRPVLKEQSQ
jgi:murein L,D-transpeptidase YcbB/YkuD